MHKKSLKGNLLLKEIAQQLMSLLAENAFGMELHAFQRQGFMAESHNFVRLAVTHRPGSHLEGIWQGAALYNQRMVAGHGQWIIQSAEHALASVLNRRGFAVHHLTRTHDLRAIRLRNCLMAQTDAQHRQLTGEMPDRRQRNA